MEQNSRKNDDCYFYYYSTCLKGDNCLFRHEENALGCEVVCQYWKEGKCLNERCNFRHMELKKNRKVIPCYWETQPSGCRKPHCPFRHINQKDKPPDKSKDGNVGGSNMVMPGGVLNIPGSTVGRNPNTDGNVTGPPVVRGDINYAPNPVDPIVVKFEEESDNESLPSSSPFKSTLSSPKCQQLLAPLRVKTLEEIKLERIQEQSAAFYNFDDNHLDYHSRRRVSILPKDSSSDDRRSKQLYADFKILTLEEIRRNRQKRLALEVDSSYCGDEYEVVTARAKRLCLLDNGYKVSLRPSVLPDSTSETQSDSVTPTSGVNYSKESEENDDRNWFLRADAINNESIKNLDSYIKSNLENNPCQDDGLPHLKQKPIKLRRLFKRSHSDENTNVKVVRHRLKRLKVASVKDSISSTSISDNYNRAYSNENITNNDTNDSCMDGHVMDPELSSTSSSAGNDDQNNDLDTLDILKDIDDLLNN